MAMSNNDVNTNPGDLPLPGKAPFVDLGGVGSIPEPILICINDEQRTFTVQTSASRDAIDFFIYIVDEGAARSVSMPDMLTAVFTDTSMLNELMSYAFQGNHDGVNWPTVEGLKSMYPALSWYSANVLAPAAMKVIGDRVNNEASGAPGFIQVPTTFNHQKRQTMNNQVTSIAMQIGGETRTFTLRKTLSPAAQTFIENDIVKAQIAGKSADDVKDYIYNNIMRDEKQINHVARIIMEGDHAGVNWFYDSDGIDFLTMFIEWLQFATQWMREKSAEINKQKKAQTEANRKRGAAKA